MRRLMLLRHAKTETDAPSGRDQDRRLDDRGHKDAAEIGDWIASHPPFPDTVLVSHAVRARQTWDVAWETMKGRVAAPEVEVLPELYGADPAQILKSIRTATNPGNPKRLLLVGHNPGIGELAASLIASGDVEARQQLIEKFPTAALAVIDFAVDDWTKLHPRGGRLDRFVVPRSLQAETD